MAALLQKRGYEVRSFGVQSEYVAGTENCTGGTIEEMVDQMAACSYFISNDSGLMNIANGLGIPLLALFGPTDVETRGPRSLCSAVLRVSKSCVPCEIHDPKTFKAGLCKCIDDIKVDEVLTAFLALADRVRQASANPGHEVLKCLF